MEIALDTVDYRIRILILSRIDHADHVFLYSYFECFEHFFLSVFSGHAGYIATKLYGDEELLFVVQICTFKVKKTKFM